MIMLVSKKVMVRWNGYTRKHYEDRGYSWTKVNDYFECDINDVMTTSTASVDVECDYCGEIHQKKYRAYIKSREVIQKDCCGNRKCMVSKSEEVNLIIYGVKNTSQTEKRKEEAREMFKTPFGEVSNFCEKKGLKLISKEEDYQNDRSRLFIICQNHKDKGVQETNFANIKSGKHCCYYGGKQHTINLKRNNSEIVYQSFKDKDLIPMFKVDDYKSNSQSLPYMCPNHMDKGIMYRSYANLTYAEGCIYCSRERTSEFHKLDQEDVFRYFNERGLFPLDGEVYKSKDVKIKFKCINHNNKIQEASFHSLQNTKQPCKYCREEMCVTSLNRKIRSSLGQWKKDSEINCDYKCILSGDIQYEIHHLYSYNNIILDALKELNIETKDKYDPDEIRIIKEKVINLHRQYPLGVCISKKIHTLFHILYGKNNNTPEQFNEFTERYNNGEFKHLLEDDINKVSSFSFE